MPALPTGVTLNLSTLGDGASCPSARDATRIFISSASAVIRGRRGVVTTATVGFSNPSFSSSTLFREAASDGVLTTEEWGRLKRIPEEGNFPLSEALYYSRPDVLELIRRAAGLAAADQIITD